MTILHDLYRNPEAKRRRVGGSGGKAMQQGQVDDSTLLDEREPHRPDSNGARVAMETRFLETAFHADWVDMTFLHFEVDAALLQNEVPFELDRLEGKAYVSLVGFTMNRFRPAVGGVATRWTTALLASHRFLNLRTYVKHRGHVGIFFLKEWLNHRLAVALGPRTFGLPYRYAEVEYEQGERTCRGRILAEEGALTFEGEKEPEPVPRGSRSRAEFLLERYTAFNNAGRRPRFFRVWHRPWSFGQIRNLQFGETTLIDHGQERWTETAILADAHWSPGVFDVWMGRPHAVS